jgi:IS30 family transposase
MSPLSKRGHVRALQISSRKRDGLVPEAERYDDRSFSIDKRKSLIDWVIQLSFLVGTIVALSVVDRKILNLSTICHAS